MSSHKIKAVLFDLDGTIINTSDLVYQAFTYTLARYEYAPVTREELSPKMGMPLRKTYELLTELEDVQHLFESHDEYQVENIHLAVPYDKLEHVLQTLQKKGIKMAVVTARGKISTERILRAHNLFDYFDTIVTFDDVTNPKPHPEPVLKALEMLGISPQEAIMTGDTDADIFAGKNAGVKTIGVTYGFQGQAIKEFDPDYVIDSLEELLPIIETS